MTHPLPPSGPRFDFADFARRLAAAVEAAGGVRAAAAASEVSASTLSRACKGWPDLSHENVLRLEAWMAARPAEVAA